MENFINTAGILMCRIAPGAFQMGDGSSCEADEVPVHRVRLSHPFAIGATPVTNSQYEKFDPSHRKLRGKKGLSFRDGEPALFVSWHDAKAYCRWLSGREAEPYRLPTEAEWEYCCRAGTRTAYSTGKTLPKIYYRAQEDQRDIIPVDLTVGQTPANAFGVRDMHGLVEEWCEDWYAPYPARDQTDPAGSETGEFRVTRGGSHNTDVRYLTSAQRMAAMPEERSCFIGFRVVRAGNALNRHPSAKTEKQWQYDVNQQPCRWAARKNGAVFSGPLPYIRVPENCREIPLYSHNHGPSVTWCDNGDLLAVWFSCEKESGREMTILASRLRKGSDRWDTPAEFFKVPDRNMTGSALYNNGKGTLYHFNGVSSAYDWAQLALVLRTSTDNGATWTRPLFADAAHQYQNQPMSGTLETKSGLLIQPCDASPLGDGGTAVHISGDGGMTWRNPAADAPRPVFRDGGTGAVIAGIHAGVAECEDGSLLAFGRGDSIRGFMPRSVSTDGGATWHYGAGGFPPISSGQRLILRKLNEGPLLLISFSDRADAFGPDGKKKRPGGIEAKDASGRPGRIYGMFAALSYDSGHTWPVKKIVSSGNAQRLNGGGWTGDFQMDGTHAEPAGYLAAVQTPDNLIHLLSSRLYYRFNLAWLEN